MAPNGIVRRIDDLGRIVIPKEIRRNMGLNDGDALEITYTNGTVSIRKYKKSFEQCAIEWFNSHQYEMNNTYFRIEGEYTFCIVRDYNTPTRAGYSKRFKDDAWDHRIGRVAAYARAMGRNLNKMIGYED
jgi:AbrB family looped-hinge helix DNA binding protein